MIPFPTDEPEEAGAGHQESSSVVGNLQEGGMQEEEIAGEAEEVGVGYQERSSVVGNLQKGSMEEEEMIPRPTDEIDEVEVGY